MSESPFEIFASWFDEAKGSEPRDHNAMTIATADTNGRPSARTVLLKQWDQDGFVFYTNTTSRKGDELAANSAGAILFYWKSLSRQIRIEGDISAVSDAQADAYFASRPRPSQLGAWASDQSARLDSRETFDRRLEEVTKRFEGQDVPRPPHWTGFRLVPHRFEFWQERDYRLHDRHVFVVKGGAWETFLLYP